MPMRVHVHAAIWIDDQLVVHRRVQREREHITLPGGRVRDREAVLVALEREVGEEIGMDIQIGNLLLAGEVHGATAQDLVLVFEAQPSGTPDPSKLHLLDPHCDEAQQVMPAVVDLLVAGRSGGPATDGARAVAWAGNLYRPGQNP
jgi:ADP-ribose pyrophosphatase YjhB (NUDIX family)